MECNAKVLAMFGDSIVNKNINIVVVIVTVLEQKMHTYMR